MSKGLRLRWFEVGHCVHPGFMVKPGSGLALRHFPAGVALIEHPVQGNLLFDTGYHRHFKTSTQYFPERIHRLVAPPTIPDTETAKSQLAQLGLNADQIDHLFLSHFHGDHIAGLSDFPTARLHCHQQGYRDFSDSNRLQCLRRGYLHSLLPDDARERLNFVGPFDLDLAEVLNLPDPHLGLAAADLFGDQQLYAVSLPGHAAGQLGLLVRLQQQWVFLLADACWLIDNLQQPINQHWLAGLICDNRRAYTDTLIKLRHCYQLCADRVLFVPSHCQQTTQRLRQAGWMQ